LVTLGDCLQIGAAGYYKAVPYYKFTHV